MWITLSKMGVDVTSDRVENLLAKADELFVPFASKAIMRAMEAVKEIIQVYAPQPSRTRSKTFNTYVRGVGRYPKSAFVRDVDQPGGYRTKKVSRAQIRMTSQQMDKRWKMTVKASKTEASGTLENTASYSGHVVGFLNEDPKQVYFHKESGWVAADDAISQAMPNIQKIANDTADEFIKIFGD